MHNMGVKWTVLVFLAVLVCQVLSEISADKDSNIILDKPKKIEVLPVGAVIRKLVYGNVTNSTDGESAQTAEEPETDEQAEIAKEAKSADDTESCDDVIAEKESRQKRQINFGGGNNQARPVNQGRPNNRPRPGGRPNRPNNNQNRPSGGNQNRPRPGGSSGQCGNCVSLAACSFAVAINQASQTCSTSDSGDGVCCPVRGPGANNRRLFTDQSPAVRMRPVPAQNVNQACEKGISFQQNVGRLEQNLMSTGKFVPRNTPARGHAKFFKTTRSARSIHASATRIAQASKNMMNDLQLTPQQGSIGLRQVSVRNSILAGECPAIPRCNPGAKYRTIDGSCNNLNNPLYGKSETAFNRILPPRYDDGVSSPRTRSVGGGELPNERIVASNVLVDRNDPDQKFTLSVMQWGQFIDHDLTHTPFASLPNGEAIECCENGRETTGPDRHPECLPIQISNTDRFYQPRGVSCMNFVRSMLGLSQDCSFGHQEQMNQITHWLDGSNIYGSNQEEASRLRSGRDGLFLLGPGNSLPLDQTSGGDCEARQRNGLCYHAGDSRVNEQPALTAIHTFWHREHNRVAGALKQIHPGWSDEALYQEARRIVVAQMQHIVYNEWLPIIVGDRFMDSFGINVLQNGYTFEYSNQINPNMNNEFATGAFRFGHSLVQGTINLFDRANNRNTIQLREHFNSPHIFQSPNMPVYNKFARAFSRQAIQKFDSFVTDDLSNHLFQTPSQNFGMDLMSLNLHRGRDHGIATYNDIRRVCGLPKANSFSDFNDQIPIDIVQRLSQLYAHPDDVDFFVGGMSEKPVSGGLLGWTFLCVVGDQFARIKKGDRFFHDIGGQPGSFTPNQLQEIRKASWARILCDNSDSLDIIQPLAFRLPDNSFNRQVNCQSNVIPRINLGHWQNEVPQA